MRSRRRKGQGRRERSKATLLPKAVAAAFSGVLVRLLISMTPLWPGAPADTVRWAHARALDAWSSFQKCKITLAMACVRPSADTLRTSAINPFSAELLDETAYLLPYSGLRRARGAYCSDKARTVQRSCDETPKST